MIKYLATGIVAFIIYIVFSGTITPYDLLTGAVVSTICSALLAPYIVRNEAKLSQPARLAYLAYYFLKYITIIEFKAHMDVVKRIFTMDLKPGIVRIPLNCKGDMARLLVASSITNTPGTVVVDESNDYFYVNWIYVSSVSPEEAKKSISEEFEKYAVKIFE
ncbi:Na+/H+ antiporter subunit E [Thermosphaera aggregans]|uniref:Cation antiporter n=1 Tax=Thermosphaera aggregans (strain DSM 11486 / M11TL) TaxID=633148 RepID=D5TZT9_THEAM|nr:Na+/H+ antiporter subunit E [Thermosphaera aggregans]ADG90389.1 cation antiporter [Thermosphaera aggregans DSM 11486]